MPVSSFDCRAYLDTVLPGLLERATTQPDREAVVQFVVRDVPACQVAYAFAPAGVTVQHGHPTRVDLTIALFSSDLEDFSRNTLDTRRALRSSRLQLTGDESLLRWLAERLTP